MTDVMTRAPAKREMLKSALARPPVTAAVDLGASKVACFIMKPDGVHKADRTLDACGVGYVQSRGVRGGSVVDLDAAVEAIALAVERAENVAGVNVQGVTVSCSLGQMSSLKVSGTVSLGARPIADNDLSRALAAALAQVRLSGRRVIHLLPIAWSVDAQRGIRDPRAMFGRSLGLDLLVVSMNESIFRTLGHCVERAHLSFEGVVASPFVSALAALEEDEMDLGAICIDMGGGSTSAAVFSGGSLVHIDSLSVGGQHVTQDIARGFQTSLVGAERLKTLYGSAIASSNEDREMIEAPPRGDDPGAGPVTAPRSLLKGIIAPRVEETLELLRDRLKEFWRARRTRRQRCPDRRRQPTGRRPRDRRSRLRPSRPPGPPARAPSLADSASGPAFCAAAGVLHRAAFGPREAASGGLNGKARRPAGEGRGNTISQIAGWLRDNL